jgi:hypothetical protein
VRLLVDTRGLIFQVTREGVAKQDQNRVQKMDKDTREPLWQIQVLALDPERGGEVIVITLVGETCPNVEVGAFVYPIELEAIPWASRGKHGVAYRAKSLQPRGSQ